MKTFKKNQVAYIKVEYTNSLDKLHRVKYKGASWSTIFATDEDIFPEIPGLRKMEEGAVEFNKMLESAIKERS